MAFDSICGEGWSLVITKLVYGLPPGIVKIDRSRAVSFSGSLPFLFVDDRDLNLLTEGG